MQCLDPTHLTPKRTSVFSSNLNAAIGSCRLPPSQVLGDATEDGDGENQNQLFKQQAHAVSTGTFHFILMMFPLSPLTCSIFRV